MLQSRLQPGIGRRAQPLILTVSKHRVAQHCRLRCAATSEVSEYPSFMPPITGEIGDKDFHPMAKKLHRVPVTVEGLKETLRTAVIGPTGGELDALGCGPNDPVVVLLHSFDSSSLEWRRLYPLLTSPTGLRMPVVALDLVGWGFTDHTAWRREPSLPLGPATKRSHLEAFRQQCLGGRPVVLIGTSLGGTIAADYALAYPQAVRRLVLIDAQGFTSGVPKLPRPLAVLGVMVLRAIWLRSMAGKMSYFNKEQFATDDAWRIGRLATFLPGWLEANVAFIQSGGYDMSEQRIKQLQPPILLLWGENDEVLPTPALPNKWVAALGPQRCQLIWIPASGHSPHLEQPALVFKHIQAFLADERVSSAQEAGERVSKVSRPQDVGVSNPQQDVAASSQQDTPASKPQEADERVSRPQEPGVDSMQAPVDDTPVEAPLQPQPPTPPAPVSNPQGKGASNPQEGASSVQAPVSNGSAQTPVQPPQPAVAAAPVSNAHEPASSAQAEAPPMPPQPVAAPAPVSNAHEPASSAPTEAPTLSQQQDVPVAVVPAI